TPATVYRPSASVVAVCGVASFAYHMPRSPSGGTPRRKSSFPHVRRWAASEAAESNAEKLRTTTATPAIGLPCWSSNRPLIGRSSAGGPVPLPIEHTRGGGTAPRPRGPPPPTPPPYSPRVVGTVTLNVPSAAALPNGCGLPSCQTSAKSAATGLPSGPVTVPV